ncbi:MAG: NAD(P)-binding domain-containing protein [Gemmatimonadota bacterium]
MLTDTQFVWVLYLVLVLLTTVPFYLHYRKREKKTEEAEAISLKYGLKEPATLHPVIDPSRCIGIGSCVEVCPEPGVLGIRNGQAVAVSPARCIGHGVCELACPVDAIQLVFGTATRGVDIPRIKENFETNVPGIYVIGELGGMGLIHNAFEQGRQCIDGILREKRQKAGDALDVLIVGCGPAGLSASLSCQESKLKFVTIDKDDVGGTVRCYPRKKLVLTQPLKVPGYGKLKIREVVKEELIDVWEEIVAAAGLEIKSEETVAEVKSAADGCFEVHTDKAVYRTLRVILAIGRRGVPRKLGVPGEDSPNVAYALAEPEAFQNDRIMVVGGGDSAIEAALSLAEQPGNQVRISYRKDRFSRIKPANLERIEEAVDKRKVEILFSTSLQEIKPDSVVYGNGGNGSSGGSGGGGGSDAVSLPNDYVFVFIGGELPTGFLKACGIEIDTKFGER